MKTRYDSKANQSPILEADIVYLQIPNLLKQGTSKKLQPIFSGPYLVCNRSNIHTAILRDVKTWKLLTRSVHSDWLKRVTDIRNNKFAGRLIKPDNDQLTKMWKIKWQRNKSDWTTTMNRQQNSSKTNTRKSEKSQNVDRNPHEIEIETKSHKHDR